MKLLLAFLLGMVVLGIVTERLDRRTYALVLASSVIVTGLFYFTQRFMT